MAQSQKGTLGLAVCQAAQTVCIIVKEVCAGFGRVRKAESALVTTCPAVCTLCFTFVRASTQLGVMVPGSCLGGCIAHASITMTCLLERCVSTSSLFLPPFHTLTAVTWTPATWRCAQFRAAMSSPHLTPPTSCHRAQEFHCRGAKTHDSLFSFSRWAAGTALQQLVNLSA